MKKLAFLTLAFAAAAGCSEDPAPSDPVPAGVTPAQRQAFEQLEATTEERWRWIQHGDLATPMHLSSTRTGKPLLARAADAVDTTVSVLAANKALFKMRNPRVELGERRVETDALGMTHARLQQLTHGVPVDGAELTAHYDAVGHLTSIDAHYVPGLDDLDVQPAIDERTAFGKVEEALHAVHEPSAKLEADAGALVVHAPGDRPARLGFRFIVHALEANEPAIWVVTADAKTGEILQRYNNLQTVRGQGVNVLGQTKTFEVSATNAGFAMVDTAGGVEIRTFTAETEQRSPGTLLTSTNASSWDTGVVGAGAAVDAHVNAEVVFQYYKTKHARNAIDGVGGPLLSTAHFGKNYDNASWDGRGMAYGDGGQQFLPLAAALDLVGHEFTHGVTEKTSGLVYLNQSGALNEAVSDIFGAFIEHSVAPDPVKNWTFGEVVSKLSPAMRDMKNPTFKNEQPSHMAQFVNTQQDNGGVHINSGIINNAAYLMTVGGVNPFSKVEVKFGIGWEKSEQVWYRANTKYFQQTTNFGQAAQGVLQSAKDLGLTTNEQNIVDCAFKATGVAQGTCATLTDPTKPQTTPDPTTSTPAKDTTGTPPTSGADSEDTSGTATAPSVRRRKVVTESGGCQMGGDAQRSNLGLFAMLGLAGLVWRGRRRSS